jgi:hypothetical protein
MEMLRCRLSLACLVGAFLLSTAGCGGSIKTYKVRGTVTLDGEALPNATVVFHPQTEGARSAAGTTDAQGNFTLTTVATNDGAMAGEYKVTVQYKDQATAEELGADDGSEKKNLKGMFMKFEKIAKTPAKKKPKPKYVVPDKYGNPSSTPFTEKVPTSGSVTLDVVSK